MAIETTIRAIKVDKWEHVEEAIDRQIESLARVGAVLHQIAGPVFSDGVKVILVFRHGGDT